MLSFTKEQLSAVMCKYAEKENVLHDILEIMLERISFADNPYCSHVVDALPFNCI